MTATVTPSDATNREVTCSSSATNVARVNASGLVTAVAQGNATITVKTIDGDKTATCTVTVSLPASDLTIHVATPGTLSSLVGVSKYSVIKLKVTGNLNSADILCIREMAGSNISGNATDGRLETIDLEGVNIVSGGGNYYSGNSTSNNAIGNYMFYNCSKLIAIKVPNSVTIFGNGAFQGCSSLSSITVPRSVLSIGLSAFSNCRNLKTFTIQDGPIELIFENGFNDHFSGSQIETIYLGRNLADDNSGRVLYNPDPFSGNTALKSVTIGNNVTMINRNSFNNCIGLTTITSRNSTPPTTGSNCFYGVNTTTCRIYVPTGRVTAYKAADGWKDFQNIL